jgi:hypothetical protein
MNSCCKTNNLFLRLRPTLLLPSLPFHGIFHAQLFFENARIQNTSRLLPTEKKEKKEK